jgi:DNA-binding IclR family transcriptional regulator
MLVLDCFADRAELTLSAVAAQTGLPVSTAHRIMRALVEGGFLARDAGDIYQVGPHVAALLLRPPATDGIAPHLYALAAGIKLTTAFGVADGRDLVTLVCARPPVHHCEAQIPARRAPLYATAMGKAIVAFDTRGPLEAARRLGRLSMHTVAAPSTNDELVADLNEVRRRGFAICDQSRREGIREAAVPVFGGGQEPLGAIGVQARSHRMTEELIHTLLPALRHFAQKVGGVLQESASRT